MGVILLNRIKFSVCCCLPFVSVWGWEGRKGGRTKTAWTRARVRAYACVCVCVWVCAYGCRKKL